MKTVEIRNLPELDVEGFLSYVYSSDDFAYRDILAYFSMELDKRPMPRLPGIKVYGFKITISPMLIYLQATASWCDSLGGRYEAKSNICILCIQNPFPLELTVKYTGKNDYIIAKKTFFINDKPKDAPKSDVYSFIFKQKPIEIKDCNDKYVIYNKIGVRKPQSENPPPPLLPQSRPLSE